MRSKIILVANTSWFLYNFESGLIEKLLLENHEVILVAPRDVWSDRLEQMGAHYIEVPMRRMGLNPISDLFLLLRFFSIYKRQQPNVVFHNTIKPTIYGSIAARLANVACILNMIPGLGYVFIGNEIHNQFLRSFVEFMYKVALRPSEKIFFQNPDDKRYFVDHRIIEEKQAEVTYGLGVDVERFYFVEPSKTQECIFLLMSRMLWDKGVGEYVEAAKKIKQSYPNVTFQLLGKIDRENPSGIQKQFIDEWNNLGIIQYLGELPDVRAAVAKADVIVLPSYREGIPNSLMEGMAMGKPIITTDVPGCRETVIHDITGVLIPPKNIPALIDAMLYMIIHPEIRSTMGREGRKLALERFDVKRVISTLMHAMHLS